MKKRYLIQMDRASGLWEVIDKATGFIEHTTPTASSAIAIADSLNNKNNKAVAEAPWIFALIARKLVIIPVLVSTTYFVLGLIFHWKDGNPEFSWLALSAGALLCLTILWGVISIVFNLTAGKSDDESS